MADIPLLESDRLAGTPHPRERYELYGQDKAQEAFVQAFKAGHLHHAWLLGGMQGIGKATLAWRIARFLCASPDFQGIQQQGIKAFDIDPQNRAARQLQALSHPNLVLLRRDMASDGKKLATQITVDQVRAIQHHFHSTSSDGGWRVAIIDAAEDLNASSANALLKLLEEPPVRSIFFIISHAPQRLLPTIRSRCRQLMLQPLDESDIITIIHSLDFTPDEDSLTKAASLSDGSIHRALDMLDPVRLKLVEAVKTLLAKLPALDLASVFALGEEIAKKDAEWKMVLMLDLVSAFVSRHLHEKAVHDPAKLIILVDTFEKGMAMAREAQSYNLDKRPVVLSLFRDLAKVMR
jgi:DNA polymerase III subunit delta'